MESQALEMDFLGQKVPLRSKGDPELTREAVALAELKLNDAKNRGNVSTPHYITLVALLELAEEFLRTKRRFSQHRESVIAKTEEVFELIETQLKN